MRFLSLFVGVLRRRLASPGLPHGGGTAGDLHPKLKPLLGIQVEDQGMPHFQARSKSEINQRVSPQRSNCLAL